MTDIDYSGFTVGMLVSAESEGKFYSAQVVTVSTSARRKKAPVKVHFMGYTAESDEWVGASRLRSKALAGELQPKAANAKQQQNKSKWVKVGDEPRQSSRKERYSMADQVARFERANKQNNRRYLDITTVFKGEAWKDKRVLVVGASKGLGLELLKELSAQGAEVLATCRKSNAEIEAAGAKKVISEVEVTEYDSLKKMADQLDGRLDYVIYNAGYFPDVKDNLETFQDAEAIKQIDVCGLGPVRCVSALKNTGRLDGSKVVVVTSQAGSIKWRFTQNKDEGGNYGHHMSRAACNIAAALMSEELKQMEIPVVMVHPGFNRTTMTSKYAHIWDKEGAVEAAIGAKRVLHEASKVTMKTSGKFINAEDGLEIPW